MAVVALAPPGPRGWAQTPTPTAVVTYHNDAARSGANLAETILTPGDVNPNQFGKLFSVAVDGDIYAQPLYLPGVTLPDGRVESLVYVATAADSVYAFAADAPGSPVWHDSLLPPGATPIPYGLVHCGDIVPNIGIIGTPVIDPASGTLYVVTQSLEDGQAVQRLHALDVASGAEKFGGPVVIAASVAGTGAGAVNGQVAFNPLQEDQRAALLLSRGVVYVAWGSHCDLEPFHGWLMAFDAQSLQLLSAFNSTPNDEGGGIWAAGSGPAADANGDVFTSTGNLGFGNDGVDWGQTVLRFAPPPAPLSAADSFTPYNEVATTAENGDVSSVGILVLPAAAGEPPPLVTGEKAGDLYVLDSAALGGYEPDCSNCQIPEWLSGASQHIFGAPAYWNCRLYVAGSKLPLQAFAWQNGQLSSTPTAATSTVFGYPSGAPSVSANGDAGGIVWMLQNDAWSSRGPTVLHAYEAATLGELYNSAMAGARDQAGPAIKFTTPTVADGEVFVGAGGELDVYGLITPQLSLTPAAPITPAGQAATLTLASSDHAPGTWTLSCLAPTSGCGFSPATITAGQSATLSVDPADLNEGDNTITVQATNGDLNASASATVTVNGLSLSTSPSSSIHLLDQSTATFALSVSGLGGFSGPISLDCSNTALVCAFQPATLTQNGVSQLSVSGLQPSGSTPQTLVVKAMGSGEDAAITARLPLTIADWDFSVSAAAADSAIVVGGNQAQFALITAGLEGFAGTITFACSGQGAATCSFSPATVSAGGTTQLIVTGLASLKSKLAFSVSASSGSDVHSLPLIVTPMDFSLAAVSDSATIAPGGVATYSLALTAVNGWTGSVRLTCSGAPTAATCAVTPAQVSFSNSGGGGGTASAAVTATVSITTTAPSLATLPPVAAGRDGPPAGSLALLIAALAIGSALSLMRSPGLGRPASAAGARGHRRRMPCALPLVLALLLALALGLAGCGGAAAPPPPPPPPSTPPGATTLTIVASGTTAGGAGALQHQLSLALTVR